MTCVSIRSLGLYTLLIREIDGKHFLNWYRKK